MNNKKGLPKQSASLYHIVYDNNITPTDSIVRTLMMMCKYSLHNLFFFLSICDKCKALNRK